MTIFEQNWENNDCNFRKVPIQIKHSHVLDIAEMGVIIIAILTQTHYMHQLKPYNNFCIHSKLNLNTFPFEGSFSYKALQPFTNYILCLT